MDVIAVVVVVVVIITVVVVLAASANTVCLVAVVAVVVAVVRRVELVACGLLAVVWVLPMAGCNGGVSWPQKTRSRKHGACCNGSWMVCAMCVVGVAIIAVVVSKQDGMG